MEDRKDIEEFYRQGKDIREIDRRKRRGGQNQGRAEIRSGEFQFRIPVLRGRGGGDNIDTRGDDDEISVRGSEE